MTAMAVNVVQSYHQKLKETWCSKSSKAATVYSRNVCLCRVLNPHLVLSRCYISSQTFTAPEVALVVEYRVTCKVPTEEHEDTKVLLLF